MRRLIALGMLVIGAIAVACTDTTDPLPAPELQTAVQDWAGACERKALGITFTNFTFEGGYTSYYYDGSTYMEWKSDIRWKWHCVGELTGLLRATCKQTQYWNGYEYVEPHMMIGAFQCTEVYNA